MSSTSGDGALRVLLQLARAAAAGDPYGFRFEPQDYILPTAGGATPTARFEWTQQVLVDLESVRLPGRNPAVVQRLGEQLRAFIRAAGWVEWEREIAQAIAAQRPVFLTIRSSAAELYALPWELLKLKSGQFIGEVDGLLLRFEWPESESVPEHPKPRPEGGRILFAWSAAAGAVPASEHMSAIARACAAGFHPFDVSADVLAHASLSRITQALEDAERAGSPVAVLHLLCHGARVGDTFGLVLDGDQGRVVVDATQLRQHLAPFAKQVRLVVLSSCDSGNLGDLGNRLGSIAQVLHRCGFQSVIASRFPLSVRGSIAIAETFYQSLLSGPGSLETAFLAARKCLVRMESDLPAERRMLDWASMQLYARHADGDDTRPVVFRPFRGLLAFQQEHRRFFVGRKNEIAEVLTDLQALVELKKPRFLVIAGASGTGKSSLVFAGAVPEILAAHPELTFLKMRPGSNPDAALDVALSNRVAQAPALLVVDQFEEVFIQTSSPADRAVFVRRLWSLASSPESGLRIVITLRVDFIGRCGELVLDGAGLRLDRVAYDEQYRVFVAQLGPEQLRTTIEKPAHKVGLELQAGLAERIVNEVGGEPGALPLLEDALDVLWQRRSDRTLTQSAYEALGGVVGALQKRADAIVAQLPPPAQALAQRLLISLVAVADDTALDSRLRVPVAELRNSVAAANASDFERVLKDLVDARLLVLDDDKQSPTVEVAHEALIRKWPRLRAWLDEDRAGLVVQRRVKQAAQLWEKQRRDDSLLFRGAQLVQAMEWRKLWESRLGDLERSFLDASEAFKRKQEQEAAARLRQTRVAAVVLGVFFLVAVGAGGLAIWNAVEAKRRADETRATLIVALAQNLKEDPTAVATLLREPGHQTSTLWGQSAVDALQIGIAQIVLRGHQASVNSVAFSPDGKKIVTGSADKTARIWKEDGSGEPVVLKGHTASIYSVAFSPDGKKVVTSGGDGTARIWNEDGSGAPVVLKRHTASIYSVAFSPEGKKVVTGGSDKTARIWNVDDSGEPVVLKGHESAVASVAFSPDGKKIATGSGDETARIWNADGSGEPIVFKGHTAPVTAVAFSLDGKKLITGSGDGSAFVWNADGSGAPVALKRHTASVYSVAFSPDGKKVVTASGDGTARIRNTDGSGESVVLKGHESFVYSVAFSPDGKKLVTGSLDNTARIWKTNGSGEPVVLKRHESFVYSVAFSPDGKKLATGSGDKTARIWSADGSGEPIVLKGHESAVASVAFSPDGKKLATGSEDKTARIWSADGSGEPIVLKGHTDVVASVAFSPDGKRIIAGSGDKSVRIWNADGSGVPIVLKMHESAVTSVLFSPNGKEIVTGSKDKTARIWNADGSGSPVVLKGPEAYVTSVAFSPDGKKIVTGSGDNTARIWNADGSGSPVVLRGHESAVTSVAFGPNGKLVSGSFDKTARIWTVASDQLLEALWSATSDCLPKRRREELLGESPAEAKQGYGRCQKEVARRHGWPTP